MTKSPFPIDITLDGELGARIDAWIAAQDGARMDRAEAARRLIEQALDEAGGKETIPTADLNASNDE